MDAMLYGIEVTFFKQRSPRRKYKTDEVAKKIYKPFSSLNLKETIHKERTQKILKILWRSCWKISVSSVLVIQFQIISFCSTFALTADP